MSNEMKQLEEHFKQEYVKLLVSVTEGMAELERRRLENPQLFAELSREMAQTIKEKEFNEKGGN